MVYSSLAALYERKELELVKLRAQVMAEIESVKKEFCNNVVIVEKFVPNPDAVSCFYHIFIFQI